MPIQNSGPRRRRSSLGGGAGKSSDRLLFRRLPCSLCGAALLVAAAEAPPILTPSSAIPQQQVDTHFVRPLSIPARRLSCGLPELSLLLATRLLAVAWIQMNPCADCSESAAAYTNRCPLSPQCSRVWQLHARTFSAPGVQRLGRRALSSTLPRHLFRCK